MKSLRITSFLGSSLLASALAIGMVASAPSAAAQTPVSKANIPFDFQAGLRVMPAGTYEISRASDHMLMLRETGQKATEFLLVHDTYTIHTPTGSSIVFDRRGDKYFLRQIWSAGNPSGLECPKSHTEQTVEAQNKQDASPVVVAMNTER